MSFLLLAMVLAAPLPEVPQRGATGGREPTPKKKKEQRPVKPLLPLEELKEFSP